MNLTLICALTISIYANLWLGYFFVRNYSFFIGIHNFAGFSFYSILFSVIVSAFLFLSTLAWLLTLLFLIVRNRGVFRIMLILIFITTVCTFIFLINGPGNYQAFTNGFKYWVQSNADLKEVETWAKGLRSEIGQTSPILIDKSQWNREIIRLKPNDVFFFPDTKEVRLVWGGGFGHWGVAFNNIPQSPNINHEYRIIISENIYVWHEIQ